MNDREKKNLPALPTIRIRRGAPIEADYPLLKHMDKIARLRALLGQMRPQTQQHHRLVLAQKPGFVQLIECRASSREVLLADISIIFDHERKADQAMVWLRGLPSAEYQAVFRRAFPFEVMFETLPEYREAR